MDHYRKMLNHFSWTWLEHKRCPYHKARHRLHDRTATKLARAHARRETRLEIEASR